MKTPHESSWTPLLWAMKLLARAKADQKISIEPPSYTNLLASFEKVENVNRKLLRYSWINFPLAYTQVRYISTICIITHKKFVFHSTLFYFILNLPLFIQVANLAVLTYFVAALFSRQYFIPDSNANEMRFWPRFGSCSFPGPWNCWPLREPADSSRT